MPKYLKTSGRKVFPSVPLCYSALQDNYIEYMAEGRGQWWTHAIKCKHWNFSWNIDSL